LTVERKLHHLVHAGHRSGEAAEIGTNAQNLDAGQIEYAAIEVQQTAGENALAQVAKLNHDHHAVRPLLPDGLLAERGDGFDFTVEADVGESYDPRDG